MKIKLIGVKVMIDETTGYETGQIELIFRSEVPRSKIDWIRDKLNECVELNE